MIFNPPHLLASDHRRTILRPPNRKAAHAATDFCFWRRWRFLWRPSPVTRPIPNYKPQGGHEAAFAKADAELDIARRKCDADKAKADSLLRAAYDAAIKRAADSGDAETAKRLRAEKAAIGAAGGRIRARSPVRR